MINNLTTSKLAAVNGDLEKGEMLGAVKGDLVIGSFAFFSLVLSSVVTFTLTSFFATILNSGVRFVIRPFCLIFSQNE